MTPARLKPFFNFFLHLQILEEDSAGLDAVLRTHLSSAAGYYYHLLTHLQLFYHLTLDSALSWGFPSSQKSKVSIFVFYAVSRGADCSFNFAEKHILKLFKPFSGHFLAIKS